MASLVEDNLCIERSKSRFVELAPSVHYTIKSASSYLENFLMNIEAALS